MNEEQEMSLETEQQPVEETAEQAVRDGDNSAQEAQEPAAEQTAAEPAQQAQGAENDPTPPPGDDAPDAGDDYDDFYHDMSDFEQPTDEAESGNTPIDPEGEDEDEGGNQGEAEPEVQPEEDVPETQPEGAEQEVQPETDAAAPEQDVPTETAPDGQVDFGSWEAEDRAAILAAHPELEATLKGKHLRDVLDDPGLFGYMRGSAENRAKYSAVEAFEKASANLLATRAATSRAKQDSKQHIRSGNGKAAAPTGSIPADMMRQLRSMFPDKTRAELEKLYKDVT